MLLHLVLLTSMLGSSCCAGRPLPPQLPNANVEAQLFTGALTQKEELKRTVSGSIQREERQLSRTIRSQYRLPNTHPMQTLGGQRLYFPSLAAPSQSASSRMSTVSRKQNHHSKRQRTSATRTTLRVSHAT